VSRSIRSRFLLSLVGATALVLATTGGVLGKCDHEPEEVCPAGVVATFDPGGTLTAGTATTVGVWVHEEEVPYVADRVEIVFSRVGDGTVIRVPAAPTAMVGRYVATVELPAGGTWSLAADVTGPDFAGSLTLDAIQVNPPADGSAGAPSPAPPLPVLAAILLAALAMGVGGGLITMSRRREAAAQG
jgi:hypothetical protein